MSGSCIGMCVPSSGGNSFVSKYAQEETLHLIAFKQQEIYIYIVVSSVASEYFSD